MTCTMNEYYMIVTFVSKSIIITCNAFSINLMWSWQCCPIDCMYPPIYIPYSSSIYLRLVCDILRKFEKMEETNYCVQVVTCLRTRKITHKVVMLFFFSIYMYQTVIWYEVGGIPMPCLLLMLCLVWLVESIYLTWSLSSSPYCLNGSALSSV